MGIDGPQVGFSCWAWDYDNDGWLDIFATCFDYSVDDVVKGMNGQPHKRLSNRLWHNVQGQKFENKTKDAGLDLVFATMGCNFGDFDNDGFLDFYLGTGDPDLSTLVPNRMFKNVDGQRFADITASSGTGNLQKGHGVSCADWDRDGDVDLFIEMGGTGMGDRYHNILFQNPGQGNHWLTVKLVGEKTNRAGHRRPDQGRHRGRSPAKHLPARHLGQQLGGQPAPADHRPGEGRADCASRDPLAHQRHDAGLSRHRRRPGHPGDRARGPLPRARLEANSTTAGRARTNPVAGRRACAVGFPLSTHSFQVAQLRAGSAGGTGGGKSTTCNMSLASVIQNDADRSPQCGSIRHGARQFDFQPVTIQFASLPRARLHP